MGGRTFLKYPPYWQKQVLNNSCRFLHTRTHAHTNKTKRCRSCCCCCSYCVAEADSGIDVSSVGVGNCCSGHKQNPSADHQERLHLMGDPQWQKRPKHDGMGLKHRGIEALSRSSICMRKWSRSGFSLHLQSTTGQVKVGTHYLLCIKLGSPRLTEDNQKDPIVCVS